MIWEEDTPWSPAEQDAYRQGRTLWRRTWRGPSPEALWALYGGHEAPGLIECPECGRPHTEPPRAPGFPLCWNCHTENTRPGWQSEAFAKIFPSTQQDQGQRETNPLTFGVKSKRLA